MAFNSKNFSVMAYANNSAAVAPAILVVSDIAAGSVTVAGVIPQGKSSEEEAA